MRIKLTRRDRVRIALDVALTLAVTAILVGWVTHPFWSHLLH